LEVSLASIPASSDTVESEGRQMKQCWIKFLFKISAFMWCWSSFYKYDTAWAPTHFLTSAHTRIYWCNCFLSDKPK
jgi:hypothetical protein